jgi:hypothetical protein
MGTARSAEGSGMHPLRAIGSSLASAQARALASSGLAPPPYAPTSVTEPTPIGTLDELNRKDPEKARELMLHFMSHVDAECFVSLLQIQDPMPYDWRDRAEWRRFYRDLHNALEIPVMSGPRPPGGG